MMILNFLHGRSDKSLIRWLSMGGVLLAGWVALMQHGRISADSVLYLEAARLFSVGDWHGALALYNWPFFSLLMAGTHLLTGLSIQSSAYLLAALSFGISTWSFLTLIKEAGGDRVTILSGVALLFSSSYIVGDVLPMIMRDQGFWAFYLLSIVFFLHFYRDLTFRNALLWQCSTVVAVLFRVEGVTFLFLLPFVMAFREDLTQRMRWSAVSKAYTVPLLGTFALLLIWIFMPTVDVQKAIGRLMDMQHTLVAVYYRITGGLSEKAHIYGDQVLGSFMSDYAMSGLLVTLLLVMTSKIMGASGWLAAALTATSRACRASSPMSDVKVILYWIVGINLLNLVVIILAVFLLAQRYAVALGFIIIFFAAFSLAGLYRIGLTEPLTWRRKMVALIIGLLLGICLIKNLIQRDPTNNYEQAAIAWVKQHSRPDAAVFYDDERLRYYAGAPWGNRDYGWDALFAKLKTNPVAYDYLVLHIKHRHPERQALLVPMTQYRLLKEFKSGNGDRIVIMAVDPIQKDASRRP